MINIAIFTCVTLYLCLGFFLSGLIYGQDTRFRAMDLLMVPMVAIFYPLLFIWFKLSGRV